MEADLRHGGGDIGNTEADKKVRLKARALQTEEREREESTAEEESGKTGVFELMRNGQRRK